MSQIEALAFRHMHERKIPCATRNFNGILEFSESYYDKQVCHLFPLLHSYCTVQYEYENSFYSSCCFCFYHTLYSNNSHLRYMYNQQHFYFVCVAHNAALRVFRFMFLWLCRMHARFVIHFIHLS